MVFDTKNHRIWKNAAEHFLLPPKIQVFYGCLKIKVKGFYGTTYLTYFFLFLPNVYVFWKLDATTDSERASKNASIKRK